jgi:hypothetical protein
MENKMADERYLDRFADRVRDPGYVSEQPASRTRF